MFDNPREAPEPYDIDSHSDWLEDRYGLDCLPADEPQTEIDDEPYVQAILAKMWAKFSEENVYEEQ
jgi:hypothetical protein